MHLRTCSIGWYSVWPSCSFPSDGLAGFQQQELPNNHDSNYNMVLVMTVIVVIMATIITVIIKVVAEELKLLEACMPILGNKTMPR